MTSTQEGNAGVDRVLVEGMAWTAALRWSAQIVSWVGTAYAARLLAPGDYGLVGMAMLAIGLVRMVEDFGMDAVLVQDRSIAGERQARIAGLVLMLGVTLSLIFVALSSLIAGFFHEPQVASLVAVLSALCVSDALQVIPRAQLQRQMAFRTLAWLQFAQVVATQGVLIAGAQLGWGVWALVGNTLAGAGLVTVLLLFLSPFRVSWPRGLRELATPLLQGWRILASRFAYYAYSSADQAVIGRILGKDALGAYSFAMTFSTTVSQEISSVLSRVVPGVFSSVQHLQAELRRYFLILTELLCYFALPISLGIAVTADVLVGLVLGPQWDAVVTPLRILCIYSAVYSSQVLIGHLLLWTGRFRANMWCSILAAILLPIGCYIGSQWGLSGVAWAWVVVFPVMNLPAFVIAFRAAGVRTHEWFGALLPALVGCIAMMAAVAAVRSALPRELSLAVTAIVAIASGAMVYTGTLLLLFRSRLLRMREFLSVIRRDGSPLAPAA
jgi:teichuronic acid exporter